MLHRISENKLFYRNLNEEHKALIVQKSLIYSPIKFVEVSDYKTLDIEFRKRLMEWVNTSTLSLHGLNGEEFLKLCVSLGADPDTKDYN